MLRKLWPHTLYLELEHLPQAIGKGSGSIGWQRTIGRCDGNTSPLQTWVLVSLLALLGFRMTQISYIQRERSYHVKPTPLISSENLKNKTLLSSFLSVLWFYHILFNMWHPRIVWNISQWPFCPTLDTSQSQGSYRDCPWPWSGFWRVSDSADTNLER